MTIRTQGHSLELVEHLGPTADSQDLWMCQCSCGWTVEGVSQRVVTKWWREHHYELQDDDDE